MHQRLGIIDIGSNSIRLVVYEQNERGAYRVIDESKSSARLSEKVGGDGRLSPDQLQPAIEALLRFKMLCSAHNATHIRTVATAAVRNAANRAEITEYMETHTGLKIEVLSGEAEAQYGFLGVLHTMDVQDGLIIDIGGGSTELTLFENRTITHSVSFPFGAVNTTKQHTKGGELNEDDIRRIQETVEASLAQHEWVKRAAGLPMIGLGGTVRSLSKIDQRKRGYSLPLTHRYEMSGQAAGEIVGELCAMPVDQRKKVDGLDKNRADLIAAGLVILQTVYRYTRSSHYIVSGSGLRDGVFYDLVSPGKPAAREVLTRSVRNLIDLHEAVSRPHIEHVHTLALSLFDQLNAGEALGTRSRDLLSAAALLYRIGVTVHYYQYEKHTFYLIAHSRIDGLTHRETLITALAAARQSKNRTRRTYLAYKDILSEDDLHTAVKLGTLLRIAVALDRSETQPVDSVMLLSKKSGHELVLRVNRNPQIELNELEAALKELKPAWGFAVQSIRLEA